MSQQLWSAVDEYVEAQLLENDPALQEALSSAEQAGLPAIAVTPAQGKLLHLLARTIGARSILELGTLGGYSSIWLARALPPEGRLVTLELSERYAEVARASIERAGVAALVDVRVGPALESLQLLRSSGEGPFDLVFIDADKQSTPEYFTHALELVHPGSLIVVDNVVRDGGLIDAQSVDPGVQGMRRFHELLTGESRVSATTIQTVGAKGYDGFTLALVE
ncbi:MAG TPA: O-methyltransferase [Solirubrobacteraceae bacterium]|jgi:predicted O-methyltransferase YrrM|nr:O-methyltransferase [Solirubrobacteraceae bacterium]